MPANLSTEMRARLALGFGLAACAASPPPDREAELPAKLAVVQRAACLRPAISSACEAGLRVSFEAREDSSWSDYTDGGIVQARKRGTIWCEDGWPRARFESFERANEVLERDVPMPVWEAIWRFLDVTDSCASTERAAVKVTRNGETRACADPRFDMHELFTMAFHMGRQGPSAATRKLPESFDKELERMCMDTPSRCIEVVEAKCPPFFGPLWPPVGPRVSTSADAGAASGLDASADASTDAPANERSNPSQGEVTAALAAVIPAARGCIGPDTPISRAQIVFRTDGTVERVTVSGGAAGKASEACIQRAFGRARVRSFSGSTPYTATVTVRPP